MSIPLFPSLRPNIIPFWCDLDPPVDEEAEIQELEREQREWKESLGQVFTNALPIGKTSNNVDEEDLDDMGDDEDGTTSSDADDMDDDDDVPGMFRIHDNLSPPPDVIASNHEPTVPASGSLDAGPIVATTDSPLSPDPEIAIVATTDSPLSPDPEISIVANTDSPLSPDPGIAAGDLFSDSLSTESLSNVTVMNTDTVCVDSGDLQLSSSRLSSRPTRTIVGRHISAPRPGVPQQPVRVAYINTAGRPVYSGRVDSGSVSPTSRFYIDAALQSPTGQIQLEVQDDNAEDDNNDEDRDESEGNSSDALSSQVSQIRPGIRSFPGPMSNLVSQYHQMVAAGHILPSVSSTQINNLIESVHQAQRVHAARATDSGEELVNALSEASPSNVGSVSSTSSDSVATRDEPANEVL